MDAMHAAASEKSDEVNASEDAVAIESGAEAGRRLMTKMKRPSAHRGNDDHQPANENASANGVRQEAVDHGCHASRDGHGDDHRCHRVLEDRRDDHARGHDQHHANHASHENHENHGNHGGHASHVSHADRYALHGDHRKCAEPQLYGR
jgi:hypothetical protein